MSHEKINFETSIAGQQITAPVYVVSNNDHPTSLLLTGYGVGHSTAKNVVNYLGSEGYPTAAGILTFPQADPLAIEAILKEAPIAVTKHINEHAGRPSDEPLSLIGHSQGGGAAILSAGTEPDLYNVVAALAPAGLTNEFLGDDVSKRKKEFLHRVIRNSMLKDNRTQIVAGLEIGGQVLRDMSPRPSRHYKVGQLLNNKFDYALSDEASERVVESAIRLSKMKSLRIFGGEDDPMFQYEEFVKKLGLIGLSDLFEKVPGSHTSLHSVPGKKQIKPVYEWVKRRSES